MALTQQPHTKYPIGQIDSQHTVDNTNNTRSSDSTPKGAIELTASQVPAPGISHNFMAVERRWSDRCFPDCPIRKEKGEGGNKDKLTLYRGNLHRGAMNSMYDTQLAEEEESWDSGG